MFKNICKIKAPFITSTLFSSENVSFQQTRSTYILKRKYPAPLSKVGHPIKPLRSKYFIYELVKDTNVEKRQPLNLILTQYVKGLGSPGQKVTVGQDYGYNSLLLPGYAVYASPENLEKFKTFELDKSKQLHSSATAPATADRLGCMLLAVVMNLENPWTIQPWHIKASFRKCGYIVPEDAITLPPKPIKGPDLELQNREFYVVVTINNFEKINVRCCIHHWSTNVVDRLQHVHEYWKSSAGSVFPEDEPVLAAIPKRHEITRRKTK